MLRGRELLGRQDAGASAPRFGSPQDLEVLAAVQDQAWVLREGVKLDNPSEFTERLNKVIIETL